MSKGKVWLVGAGPGDPGLLTVKATETIKDADVIVYDALIGDALFSLFPRDAEYISVGKRAGNHTMPQEEIDQLLLELAQQGKKVVRLKGGDPFLFGRGGEELELLAERGIPYEIVPGVTSPIAVPAYNGIPVTHRDYTSSLHIITGHKRKGSDEGIDFAALVRTQGTLVFLMGIARLEYICEGLIQGGMDPDMPAAVLQQGTTAGQKRIVATVGTLVEETRRHGVETPAIIIVGRVCALADQFAWVERLPLAGSRVIVTRPRGTISRMAARLRKLGAEVLELPSIETRAREDQSQLKEALDRMEKAGAKNTPGADSATDSAGMKCPTDTADPMDAADVVGGYDWIVFTSPTGVRVFFDVLRSCGKDVRSLASLCIAAIGMGTKKELADRNLIVDFVPSVYDGDTLGKELAQRVKKGDRILIPRASAGNQKLVEQLEEAGAVVDDIPIYDTVDARQDLVDEAALFEQNKIDCAVFTSASTVRGFVSRNPGLDYSLVRAACIGKQTKACADEYGMQTRMSDEATIDSLVQLVVSMKQKQQSKQ